MAQGTCAIGTVAGNLRISHVSLATFFVSMAKLGRQWQIYRLPVAIIMKDFFVSRAIGARPNCHWHGIGASGTVEICQWQITNYFGASLAGISSVIGNIFRQWQEKNSRECHWHSLHFPDGVAVFNSLNLLCSGIRRQVETRDGDETKFQESWEAQIVSSLR